MLIKKASVIGLLLVACMCLPLYSQGKETLAVLDFQTEAVSEVEMNAIVEFLSAELFKTNKYVVIDVSQRETILSEMEFSMQGCTDDTCALEIGKMLSAEMIVTGNLSKVGSRYLMSVKMLETETSRTMGTANGKYKDLDELIDGLEPIAFGLAGLDSTAAVAAEPEPEPVSTNARQRTVPTPEQGEETVATAAAPEEAGGPAQTARDTAEESKKAEKSGGSAVPAIVCTATGIAGIGAGGYFLYRLFSNSLPAYNTAKDAYDLAYGDDADYTGLYNASADAYDKAFLDFVIGAGAAGLGVVLTTVGIILFPPKEDKGTELSFMPVISDNPGMVLRVSY